MSQSVDLQADDLQVLGDKAVEQALALIRTRFETGRAPSHMHYHDTAHTRGVIDRALAIGRVLEMTGRELLLTRIAAAFHDVVQDWHTVMRDGATLRVRHAGANEVASAKEATDCMGALSAPFTAAEQGIVATAIIVTIPGWDVPYGSVVQPFLRPDGGKVVRALALADLGSSGMDPDTFCSDGQRLFAEENMDVIAALEAACTADDIAADQQKAFRARYLAWLKTQPAFARGRQRLFAEVETVGLDDESRSRLEALFSRYDASIAAAEVAVAVAEAADFMTLMRQLDPGAFRGESGGGRADRKLLSA